MRALIHRLLPAAWRRGRRAPRRDGVRVVPGPGGPRRARASFVAVEEEPGLAG